MKRFVVAIGIKTDEDFSADELRSMLNDNCFQHIDGAPFSMEMVVCDVTENYDGVLDEIMTVY